MKKKQKTSFEEVEKMVEKVVTEYPELKCKKDSLLQDK